jgi:hypothetical protein
MLDTSSDDAMRRMGELPFEQRWQFGREFMQRRMAKAAEDYFKMSAGQRREYLKKQIEEMEKRRREWEARRNEEQGAGQGNGQGQGQGNGQGQGQGQGQGNGGRGPGGRNASPEQRSQMANRRLDNSTPQQRAQQAAFAQDMRAARAAAGLPLGRGGR